MTATGPVGVGIIGAGVISETYLDNLTSFPDVRVLAVGDLDAAAAQAKSRAHGVPVAGAVDVVLDHPDVEVVVNLTTPAAHVQVATQALAAGKHVWNEKPLALDRDGARQLLERSASAGLRVGCAPDTFLGNGLQAAHRAVSTDIGRPLTALVLLQGAGPDRWHPNPAFYFTEGGGPLLDMGPYYLTALVQALGPVAEVSAAGSTARRQRVVAAGPRAGEQLTVTVPTHVSALLRFEGGTSATVVLSFDSPVGRTLLEITGTDGTCTYPDPNHFGGDVVLTRVETEPAVTTVAAGASRGLGVLDLARSLRAGEPHRADAVLAHHVLDVMLCVTEALDTQTWIPVRSTATVAPPLPAGWDPYARTL